MTLLQLQNEHMSKNLFDSLINKKKTVILKIIQRAPP